MAIFDSSSYRDLGELCASAAVTDEHVLLAKQHLEKLEKAAAAKCLGFYKIEILFGRDHHVDGRPTSGIVTLWESGTKLHGGGDALLYTCPGKHQKMNDCEEIIPDHLNGRGIVVCPHCRTAWKSEYLIGETYYRFSIKTWAVVIHKLFLRLGMNADIRVKYFYEDIRKAAEQEQHKELRGDILERARSEEKRTSRVYPLANIIKDVNAGADMYLRILAFLRM